MRITPSLLALFASSCVANTTDPADPTDPTSPDPALARLQECRGRVFVPAPTEDWRHSIQTPIITAIGAANHMGRDLIVKASTGATINAKFTYGLISKDLENEDVRVSIDDCTGWVDLGDFTTDSDGQIRVALTRSLPIGVYDLRFQVLGDGSTTSASLWVLPAGTQLVVTDIDGTLTSSDSELFEQILDGSHIPAAYPDAAALTSAHVARGFIPVYLTGEPSEVVIMDIPEFEAALVKAHEQAAAVAFTAMVVVGLAALGGLFFYRKARPLPRWLAATVHTAGTCTLLRRRSRVCSRMNSRGNPGSGPVPAKLP